MQATIENRPILHRISLAPRGRKSIALIATDRRKKNEIARPMEGYMRIDRNKLVSHALFCVLAISFAGCQGSQIGAKRWSGGIFGQGSEDRQKYRAASFDPYPLNDIGPEVVGGRPRGFQNPLPEASRNQIESKANMKRRSMGSGW